MLNNSLMYILSILLGEGCCIFDCQDFEKKSVLSVVLPITGYRNIKTFNKYYIVVIAWV